METEGNLAPQTQSLHLRKQVFLSFVDCQLE